MQLFTQARRRSSAYRPRYITATIYVFAFGRANPVPHTSLVASPVPACGRLLEARIAAGSGGSGDSLGIIFCHCIIINFDTSPLLLLNSVQLSEEWRIVNIVSRHSNMLNTGGNIVSATCIQKLELIFHNIDLNRYMALLATSPSETVPADIETLPPVDLTQLAKEYISTYSFAREFQTYCPVTLQPFPSMKTPDGAFKTRAKAILNACIDADRSQLASVLTSSPEHCLKEFILDTLFAQRDKLEELATRYGALLELGMPSPTLCCPIHP